MTTALPACSQIFSPARFCAFMVKFVTENRNRLLMLAAITILIPLVVSLGVPWFSDYYDSPTDSPIDPAWSAEMRSFTFLFVFMTAYYASLFYFPLGNKTSRGQLLLTPASSLEKFSVFFVLYIVAGSLLYIGATFFADWVRVLAFSSDAAASGVPCQTISIDYILTFGFVPDGSFSSLMPEEMRMFLRLVLSVVILNVLVGQAVNALGSAVWPKNAFLKTICCYIVFWIVYVILFHWGTHLFFSDGHYMERSWFSREVLSMTRLVWLDIIGLIVVIGVWALAYFRFKEWEIIKRW